MTIPILKGRRTTEIDFDEWARKCARRDHIRLNDRNPYKTPKGAQKLLDEFHAERRVVGSYGSYGEDRTFVWRQTYLDALKGCVHIGLDINVAAGSLVVADTDCEVVWVGTDHPEPHGWGNRVIVKLRHIDIWIIYAHLGAPIVQVGRPLGPGSGLGYVGAPHENGGWFPHLHLQTMTREAWRMFQQDPRTIDGYCSRLEWRKWKALCPNPARFLQIP